MTDFRLFPLSVYPIDLFTGASLIAAAFLMGLRLIWISPENRSFPCAPFAVRAIMFLTVWAIAVLGVLFIGYRPAPYGGDASIPFAVVAGLTALYNVIVTLNLLASRRTPKQWAKAEKILNADHPGSGRMPFLGIF